MHGSGASAAQTVGRVASSKRRQRRSAVNCTHGTPAGLPVGMPGIGVEIDGAMQQAAQPGRQRMRRLSAVRPRTAASRSTLGVYGDDYLTSSID
jgi:hypothetical protein